MSGSRGGEGAGGHFAVAHVVGNQVLAVLSGFLIVVGPVENRMSETRVDFIRKGVSLEQVVAATHVEG